MLKDNLRPVNNQHIIAEIQSFFASSSFPRLPITSENADNFYFLQPNYNKGIDVKTIRKDFPTLQQKINGKPLIWLDNAATTQKPQIVIDTVSKFYSQDNSNVHRGAHTLARRATDALEGARQKIMRFIGARSPEEIIFVRGATEAINLVAQSYGRMMVKPGDEIIVSTLEHHANIVPWQTLCKEKHAALRVIPINENAEIKLDEYAKLLTPKTRLVSITHVSNSVGTVLPIKTMIEMAHSINVPVLVDGAQGIPHFKIDVTELDADFYVFSGHKLFAPTGIGVLYGKKTLLEQMPPWQSGGNMIKTVTFEHTTFNSLPNKFEAGTGHIAGAVGLGAAIDYLVNIGLDKIEHYENKLILYATEALYKIPKLRQVGTATHKAGILSFVVPGVSSEHIAQSLDEQGIAVRVGHHCAQPSLRHFGLDSTVRPSVAFYNTIDEIDELVLGIQKAINQNR